jgi:23S rRNA pseudouridine1911/1915/1917 synthase
MADLNSKGQTLNQGWTYTDQIGPRDAGMSILDFYAKRYRHSSRDEWQERIEAGQVLIDGRPGHPTDQLHLGQRLEYHRPAWVEPDVPLQFEEIYGDDDILIINKPAGMPVLPGGNFLNHTLLHQLQLRYPNNLPVPVHRLGRGTSGVTVLARSHLARSTLSRHFRESTAGIQLPNGSRPIRKIYRALIGPSDLPEQFQITTPIGKVNYPVLGYVYAATATGKPARSNVQVLKRTPDSTLVEVGIQTGRPHQIRIHLAAAGNPLLGDPLYGVGGVPKSLESLPGEIAVPGDTGYLLHAHRLDLVHPRTGQLMQFGWEPPPALT